MRVCKGCESNQNTENKRKRRKDTSKREVCSRCLWCAAKRATASVLPVRRPLAAPAELTVLSTSAFPRARLSLLALLPLSLALRAAPHHTSRCLSRVFPKTPPHTHKRARITRRQKQTHERGAPSHVRYHHTASSTHANPRGPTPRHLSKKDVEQPHHCPLRPPLFAHLSTDVRCSTHAAPRAARLRRLRGARAFHGRRRTRPPKPHARGGGPAAERLCRHARASRVGRAPLRCGKHRLAGGA